LGQARGGLGIGLTLVRTIVELHGGSVAAQSEGAGRGTSIAVRLPLHLHEQVPTDSPPENAALSG
jgi:signal transduction histidine kinase